MTIIKCRNCGMEIARTQTKKGTTVLCDVYWDGEFRLYMKNHQPTPHSCTDKENLHAKKIL